MVPPSPARAELSRGVLDIDCGAETERIVNVMRAEVGRFRKRGVVIAVSGGVDSALCLALAARAFGVTRVVGLLMPERDSSTTSSTRGARVCDHFGVSHVLEQITDALDALGCYQRRDDAIRRVFPAYTTGWKNKIVIAGGALGAINYFKLVVQSPDGATLSKRLPAREYLEIVAATNFKQRVRKTLEYFHADRLNYAVLGTPNRLEYDQGFFVKNGDGAADLKPIAHLYKTQVYALARHLGVPDDVCAATPTTDTYSLHQGQDEFFFALPYEAMDLALWAHDHAIAAADLAAAISVTEQQATFVYRDIEQKRRATAYLHAPPSLTEPVLRT